MRRDYASAASVLTIPDFRTSGPTARLHDHRLVPIAGAEAISRLHAFGRFSARSIRCVARIQGRMIHRMRMFCGALWRSVSLPVFLQGNLGHTFGGTPVNSTCVFEVSGPVRARVVRNRGFLDS